jgi:hypothetical protein
MGGTKIWGWREGNGRAMLYPKGSQNIGTQRIQATARPAKIWWVARTQVVVVILYSGSTNTRRIKSNNNAKLVATPHRRNTVLVKHATRRFHWKFGRIRKSIHEKFMVNIQTTSINRRSQILYAEIGQSIAFIYRMVECNKKLSIRHLRRASNRCLCIWPSPFGLVEELGRTKPKMVSELMEIANRFADGENGYHSKRAHSPKYNRSSRQRNQRRRPRNNDGRTMRNQVAAGYKRRNRERDENEEYHKKDNYRWDRPKYSDPSAEDILHGPCCIHYAYLDGKRVSNHLMRDCRTFLKFQEAMELIQGSKPGCTTYDRTTTDQGYQIQSGTGYPNQRCKYLQWSSLFQSLKKNRKAYRGK